ncbi:hypothetical protein BDV36DRAFT_259289 [Aspergillus pseudocaelatus]|uniref:Uncharacterized protein n=1 Tax=Aspergillus pseudocaelatus TaxID=1825620 RepID=A0ABQ6WHQ4_9EURO|nr:hypothetical protein BDV36DRAFT_259289 [Aspergillus pseudocaelatus]
MGTVKCDLLKIEGCRATLFKVDEPRGSFGLVLSGGGDIKFRFSMRFQMKRELVLTSCWWFGAGLGLCCDT